MTLLSCLNQVGFPAVSGASLGRLLTSSPRYRAPLAPTLFLLSLIFSMLPFALSLSIFAGVATSEAHGIGSTEDAVDRRYRTTMKGRARSGKPHWMRK